MTEERRDDEEGAGMTRMSRDDDVYLLGSSNLVSFIRLPPSKFPSPALDNLYRHGSPVQRLI